MVRLLTETQHPTLPGSALKVCVAPPPLIWWRCRLLYVESKFSDRLWLSFSLALAQAEQHHILFGLSLQVFVGGGNGIETGGELCAKSDLKPAYQNIPSVHGGKCSSSHLVS